MQAVFFLYFTTLIKQIFVLLFLGSFIPLILLAFNYPWHVITPIFRDILLLALPWFLWFHQAIFCGFTQVRTKFLQFFLILFSSCLTTILLLGIFPYTQKFLPLNIIQISPNITAPKGPIITSPQGTLIIDPNSLERPLFAKTNTKALWVDSNFLLFQTISTNTQSFDLGLPESFISFTYYPQQGTKTIPFSQSHPSFPQYHLGQMIIQTWFDNITTLNKNIRLLYESIEIPLPLLSNQQFTEIQTTKPSKNLQDPDLSQEYNQYKTFSQHSKQEFTKRESSSKNRQEWIFDYLNIFLSLLCIFSVASLLGIGATIQQSFLGSLAIILIMSLYAPGFSTKIMNLSLKFHTLQPTYSILLINLLLVCLLYLCTMVVSSFKKSIKGETY
ncbi:MAG: hypothetical protein ACRCWI_07550 [Brevinema sp.]